jgi:hypothetical protein
MTKAHGGLVIWQPSGRIWSIHCLSAGYDEAERGEGTAIISIISVLLHNCKYSMLFIGRYCYRGNLLLHCKGITQTHTSERLPGNRSRPTLTSEPARGESSCL